MTSPETIEGYLQDLERALNRRLPGETGRVERILRETEDHLRSARESHAEGTPTSEAERAAISRFGSPDAVARRFARELAPALSRSELATRSGLHLGTFVGAVLMAAGLAAVLLSIVASASGMYQVLGWDHGMSIIYSPEECIGWAPSGGYSRMVSSAEEGVNSPLDCALFHSAQRDEFASDLHRWLAVGGTVALVIGAVLSLSFRALLRRHAAGEDYSPAGSAHAFIGFAFFGLLFLGLAVWFALHIVHWYPNTALAYWIGAGLVASALFVASYVRAAYRVLA